jgi:hypothetical protein
LDKDFGIDTQLSFWQSGPRKKQVPVYSSYLLVIQNGRAVTEETAGTQVIPDGLVCEVDRYGGSIIQKRKKIR